MVDKFKKLKDKYHTLENEKNDEKVNYEGFIDDLNEKIYKIEGKKYFYTNRFINTLKVNDSRSKSNKKSSSKTPDMHEKHGSAGSSGNIGGFIPNSNKRPISKGKNTASHNPHYLEHGSEFCERYERLEEERLEK